MLRPLPRRVLSLAMPICINEVVTFSAYLITSMQISALGSAQQSAHTLAMTLFNITGFSM